MDNLFTPAYPLPIARHANGTLNTTFDVDTTSGGFTKLEKAALMIAQGMVGNIMYNQLDADDIAVTAAAIAKEVLKESNK